MARLFLGKRGAYENPIKDMDGQRLCDKPDSVFRLFSNL